MMQAEDGNILDMSLNSQNILNKLHLLLSVLHFLLSAWYFMHLFINSKRGGGREGLSWAHVDQDTSSARVGQDRADVQPRARTPGGLTTHEAENEGARGEASERRTLPRRIDSADGRTEGQTDPPWIYSDSAERERERALNARPAAANAHWEKFAHA